MTITELIEALRWMKKDHGDIEVAIDTGRGDLGRVVNFYRQDRGPLLIIDTREPVYGASLDGPS